MNYLAHLYLAGENEAKIGGLLGDFEKGNVKGKYSKEIEIEIEIHRKIDVYTDNHLVIKDAKKVVEEEKRRYIGILLDVFYDHLLAKNWKKYSDMELVDFTKQTYGILLKHKEMLPEKLNEIIPIMIEQDWLTSYQDFVGFQMAIGRISQRLKRGDILLQCVSDIENNYSFISSGFDVFFPQLIDYVYQQKQLLCVF